MQMRNKKYYKILDSTEKLAIWQKEFDANISIIHPQFKEALLYFISKSWTNNVLYSAKKYNSNISSLINGSTSIEPDEDFFVVNKTTWYSIKNRIRIKEKPFRKLGFFVVYFEGSNYMQKFREVGDGIITVNSHVYLAELPKHCKKCYFLLPNTMATPLEVINQVKDFGYK